MKKFNIIILSFIAFFLSIKSYGQQPQVYNQFFMNPYMYNPAYVGVEGHTVLFAFFRRQWNSLSGADRGPETKHVSFHIPLKGGIAFGASAFNVSQGPLSTSAGKITGGYLVNIDRTHFLRFGLSIGGGVNGVNIDKFDSPDDRAFNNFVETNAFLIGDFGLTYHFGHFNIGISLPNVFGYNPIVQEKFSTPTIRPQDNILFKANYRGHISDNFALEPHVIYRLRQNLPNQYEATLIAHIKHIVWVGASYRQDEGIIALAGAKLFEKIGLGFSYEPGNFNTSSLLGPTFEVKIGYHLGTKKEHAQHVSSFIKSHRLSAEERERKKQLALEKQKNEEKEDELTIVKETEPEENDITGGEKTEIVAKNNEVVEEKNETVDLTEEKQKIIVDSEPEENKIIEDNKEKIIVKDNNNVISEDGDIEDAKKEEIVTEESTEENVIVKKEIMEKEKPVTNEEPTLEESPTVKEIITTNEDTYQDKPATVKKGNHLLELPSGNYVIAGAFKEFEHAENFSDDLFKRGYHDSKVGYSSQKGYYYVVIYESNSLSSARIKRNQFIKKPKLSKVWVLQILD